MDVRYEKIEEIYWKTPMSEIGDKGDFSKFYEHLKQVLFLGIEEMRVKKTVKNPKLSKEVICAFMKQMQMITLRTLIFEMEICEECGELRGNDEREKYLFFSNVMLADKAYLRELYKEYPVMYKAMLNAICHWVRNICEILYYFEQDKVGINQRFYTNSSCKEIQEIDGGSSDSHNGGRRVYILKLDNGQKLLYKPRNMSVDQKYRDFLKWTSNGVGVPFWWNQIWNRDEYGWSEWVEARPCSTYEQLKHYYMRNGILLCISYLLGSEDLHYENIIAHGEYPVIIDLETVIGSHGVHERNREQSETERIYRESVLQTGMLPLYTWNERGEGVNVGAINGKGGQLVPILMPRVVNAGTVHMHIEYYQPLMSEGKNLATLNGEFIQPYEFLNEIEEGFEKTYSFLLNHKKEVCEKLSAFCTTPIRYLIRETQQYSMMLMTYFHPDNLVESVAPAIVLSRLVGVKNTEKDEKELWKWQQEIRELIEVDIPYFWYDAFKNDLHTGGGHVFKDYFKSPTINNVINRLCQMDDIDMRRQEKLIRAALLPGTKRNIEKKKKTDASFDINISQDDIETIIAGRIGEILLQEAIWSDDGKDVGWISIVMAGYRERGYLIRPMGLYLYDGLSGILLFMNRLEDRIPKKEYEDIVDILLEKLFNHTSQLYKESSAEDVPTGAFSGEASIALVYILLYVSSKDTVFLEFLYRQCQVIERLLPYDKTYDVTGGNAGAALVFLYAYEITGNVKYLEWAEKAGNYLLHHATEYEWGLGWNNPFAGKALTGFAHGASGIMLALAKLSFYSGNEKYSEAAYRAYQFEEHFYHEKDLDWEDLRYTESNEKPKEYSMAWCHGWGGIVMARMATAEYVQGKFKEQLRGTYDFAQKKKSAYQSDSFSLCHGKCGNAALLYNEGKYEKADEWRTSVFREIYEFGDDIQEGLGIQECANFGLIGGITGIGYSSLTEYENVLNLLSVGCFEKNIKNRGQKGAIGGQVVELSVKS